MKSVGLDIGSYSIKVAEVEAGGKNDGTVIGFTEYPLNPDPRADRQLEFVEALRTIVSGYDPAATKFIVGIPQSEISSRYKVFPFRERPKILKSLAFELEDEIPLDVDETVFEAKICEFHGNSADVLTLACPDESIASLLTKMKDGGVDPEIISAEGVALGNCFERWYLPPPQFPPRVLPPEQEDGDAKIPTPPVSPREARVVLDIGHTRTLMLCYREGSLVATRSIFWGGVEIADSLAKTFSIPFFEAVSILKRKSFILMNSAGASRDQITLSTAVSSQIDNLVREVRLTLLDLKTEHNLIFTQVDLLGGVSQIQNLAPYLTQMLEIPANPYHHFETYKQVRLEITPGLGSVSALAIGLALEGLKKPRNPAANFRRGEFARQNKTLQLLWERWRPAAITAAATLGAFTIFSFVRDMRADDLVLIIEEKLSEQAANLSLPKNQRSSTGVSKYIKDIQRQVQAREQMAKLDSFNSALDILQKISSQMPVGSTTNGAKVNMSVKRFNVDNDTVVIEGLVKNPAHVEAVKKALEKVAVAKSLVKNSPSTTPEAGSFAFAFEFRVNRLEN